MARPSTPLRRAKIAVAVLAVLALALAGAGCSAKHRYVEVKIPGPTVTATETRTASANPSTDGSPSGSSGGSSGGSPSGSSSGLPSVLPLITAGTVMTGPTRGTGTSAILTTVTLTGSQIMTLTAACRGGGTLAIVAASGISSRADTLTCNGAVSRDPLPANDFFGSATVEVEGLASQSWVLLVQRT